MMAKMVDIGRKPDVRRRAVATGLIHLKPATIRAIRARHVEKGDPLPTAEIAGLQAMKAVWQVLPHTHPIPITAASVTFNVRSDRIAVTTSVEATYKTGVVIALVGTNVVLGVLALTGAPLTAPKDAMGLVDGIVTVVVLAIFMIVLIMVIGRGGGKE